MSSEDQVFIIPVVCLPNFDGATAIRDYGDLSRLAEHDTLHASKDLSKMVGYTVEKLSKVHETVSS